MVARNAPEELVLTGITVMTLFSQTLPKLFGADCPEIIMFSKTNVLDAKSYELVISVVILSSQTEVSAAPCPNSMVPPAFGDKVIELARTIEINDIGNRTIAVRRIFDLPELFENLEPPKEPPRGVLLIPGHYPLAPYTQNRP